MIPASAVKKLREKTGAGMMDCKSLTEAGGDIDKRLSFCVKDVSAAKRADHCC